MKPLILRALILLIASNVYSLGQGAVATAAADPQEETSAKKEEKTEDLAKKSRKLVHELEVGRLELQVVELNTEIQAQGIAAKIAKAQRELELAGQALEHFTKDTAPLATREAKIRIDRARYAAEHAKDELNELVAMYQADEFAAMTKELVLKRGRRGLELAERELEVQRTKLAHLEGSEHPRKKKELEGKVQDARGDLASANLEEKKITLEIQISTTKARFTLAELQRDLAEVEAKLNEKVAQ